MYKKLKPKCYFGCVIDGPLHRFPFYDQDNIERHFDESHRLPSHRLTKNGLPTLNICKVKKPEKLDRMEDAINNLNLEQPVTPSLLPAPTVVKTKLEVCIDSLESAINAIQGGADELEVCSSLTEGGLTPSLGLVLEILQLINNEMKSDNSNERPKINVMIRCRAGSDFIYTEQEMKTMISDIDIYKNYGIDRFVFGALTPNQEIDIKNCIRVIEKAQPIPVTFHRAFDVCREPKIAIDDIIKLRFTRLLTSGQKISAANVNALELLKYLLHKYKDEIEIMPGAGVNCDNAAVFVKMGFSIIHSSCKYVLDLPDVGGELSMGAKEMYVTDESIVKKLKNVIELNS